MRTFYIIHNVANPIEETEAEPEVVTYFRENFANLNQVVVVVVVVVGCPFIKHFCCPPNL